MKASLALLCLLGLASIVPAQPLLYKDVAVIVNDSSQTSVMIGNYFAQQRGITPNRILHVSAPATDEIDSLQFEDLRAQIEAGLIGGNLLDSVEFLVTTKGMPSAVSIRNGCDSADYVSTQAFERCTSVESELTLILGPYAGSILMPGPLVSPYAGSGQAFSRDSYGVYIVSRLDGYTEADAMALVDHGGPDRSLYIPDAEIVLDHCYLGVGSQLGPFFDMYAPDLDTAMTMMGYNVTTDAVPNTYVQNVDNVLGYVAALGADSTGTLDPNLNFLPGSLADLWLDNGPITTHDPMYYRAGDAIRDGAAAVSSHVGLGYFSFSFQAKLFLPLYANVVVGRRFYASEAYYLSTRGLSQAHVFLGDPKTSVVPSLILSAQDVEPISFAMAPNPSDGRFVLRLASEYEGNNLLEITDLAGRVLLQSSHRGTNTISVDATALPSGMYVVRLSNSQNTFSKRLSIVH